MRTIFDEIKDDYSLAVKKAVVDFVLGDAMTKYAKKEEIAPARSEIKQLKLKWKHRYDENRTKIKRNLFSINACSEQVLELWDTTFKNLLLVDVKQLIEKGQAYDLTEFTVGFGKLQRHPHDRYFLLYQSTVNQQIEEAKIMLNEKWYGSIKTIFNKGVKKKLIPDEVTKPKMLRKFFNSLATLMTRQLQNLCVSSVKAYTEYICDVGVRFYLFCISLNDTKNTFLPENKPRLPADDSAREPRHAVVYSELLPVSNRDHQDYRQRREGGEELQAHRADTEAELSVRGTAVEGKSKFFSFCELLRSECG